MLMQVGVVRVLNVGAVVVAVTTNAPRVVHLLKGILRGGNHCFIIRRVAGRHGRLGRFARDSASMYRELVFVVMVNAAPMVEGIFPAVKVREGLFIHEAMEQRNTPNAIFGFASSIEVQPEAVTQKVLLLPPRFGGLEQWLGMGCR